MIGYLNGRAAAGALVVVAGVGYLVATPQPLPAGEDIEVWVHTAVRENDISLYGFTSPAERDLFGALTKVTGIGPKVALGILSLGADQVVSAITAKDARALAKAPGIGVKKAESLLASVTLPDGLADAFEPVPDLHTELVDALTRLGFDPGQARTTLAELAAAGVRDEPTLMRHAMRTLRAAS